MAYRALYREYRPKLFQEVIGQSHITTILQNQISAEHVAHAYLFCGSRGTGKTSTAKIFARALNCESPVGGEPCGVCRACVRSARQDCPDIVEMDAATNNGVDNVRSLIEKAQYTPLELKKRVFIIDEAHMITGPAFNALLKTLEEPPSHVVFILATTEPQKIPATIISRCQRFDFHRLTAADIESNLRSVLNQANAQADDEALSIIAHAAEGSMRDALSLADQCLSFCGGTITSADVNDILGSMEQNFLFQLSEELIALNADKTLQMLDKVGRSGRTLPVFCQDLAGHFRSLLLAKTCGRCEDILECTPELMDRYLRQAEKASGSWLLSSLETLLRVRSELRYFLSPRIPLESALVRICHPEAAVSVSNLETRIALLEKQLSALASGAAVLAPVPSSPGPAADPGPADPAEDSAVQTPADISSVPPALRTEKAPELRSAPLRNDAGAEAVWNAVLMAVERNNPLEVEFLSHAFPQSLQNNVLTVGYDKSREALYNIVNTKTHQDKISRALEEVRPGTRLATVLTTRQPVSDETEARLRAEFGDKLTIEE